MISKNLEKLAFHFWSEGGGPYYLLIMLFLTIFVAPPLVIAKSCRVLSFMVPWLSSY